MRSIIATIMLKILPAESKAAGCIIRFFKYALIVLLLFALYAFISHAFLFIRSTGNSPFFRGKMVIDTAAYLQNAQWMIAHDKWFLTDDTYHAVGMSVYLSWFVRLFGENFSGVKFVNFTWWLLGMLSLSIIVLQASNKNVITALCAVSLYASSFTMQKYCAILQYEIIVVGLFMGTTMIAAISSRRIVSEIAGGMGVFLLCVFRLHFVIIFLVRGIYLLRRMMLAKIVVERQALRHSLFLFIIAFLFPTLLWNGYYSLQRQQFFFFQSDYLWLFDRFLNPNAQGWDYPFPRIIAPSGIQFILDQPWAYMSLLGRKTLYFFGFLPDVWHIESFWTVTISNYLDLSVDAARKVFASIYVLSFVFGLAVRIYDLRRKSFRTYEVYFLGMLLSVALTQSIHGSSTRFLLPLFPVLLYLQIYPFIRGLPWCTPTFSRLLRLCLSDQSTKRFTSTYLNL